MFIYNEKERYYWINGDTIESPIKFELVGIILGLAIYNGVILDVHFPMVIYKKLMNQNPDLDDMKFMDPEVGRSLQSILDNTSPTLESELGLNFTHTYETCWGETKVVELKPNGANIWVNQENKQEYVDLFVDFIFNKQI